MVTPEPYELFEAALTKLNEESAWRVSRARDLIERAALHLLRLETEEAMRAYYFEPAVEPTRTLIYPADGDNGSKSV